MNLFTQMFRPLCFGTIVLLIAGCTTQPVTRPAADPARQGPADIQVAPATVTIPARPVPGLDSETLYKLLVAEIAGQRDKLAVAVDNYRDVARATRDPEIIERAIRIAVYARDDEASADIANLWLEVEPGNPDAHQVLAAVAIHAGDADTAVSHLEKILNADEGAFAEKLWIIANMLGREKDNEAALEVMERLVARHQDSPEALSAYAQVALRMDELERAETLLERVLELEPQNASAAMNYLVVLQKRGDRQTALEWLEDNIDEHPQNFNMRLLYARLLTDARRFDAAQTQFAHLAEEEPENVDVLYALGLLSLQSLQLDEAADYFNRLLKLDQRVQEARYYLGRIAEEKGRLDDASDYYASVESGENRFDAQMRMGLMLARQGQVVAALEHLDAIEAGSEEEKLLLIQTEGDILIRQKRYQEAMALYNDALENSDHPDLRYGRAMLAEKMDRMELLERDLRRILEENPDHVQALNALGYTLADRTDRLKEAHSLIKQALELRPNDFYILDSMGWVLYRMGRLDQAEEYLRKALELRNDPEVAAHLGEVLWVKGDRQAAQEIWETALKQTPDDERLLDVIKRFNP